MLAYSRPRTSQTRWSLVLLTVVIFALLSGCATTGNKSTRTSLATPKSSTNVLLMPIDVELSVLTAGGVLEPRADWTEVAQKHLGQAFTDYQNTRDFQLVPYQQTEDGDPLNQKLVEIERLHGLVGQSILIHEFVSTNRLPSKNEFDWTLGPEVNALKQKHADADYALFVFIRDSYSSSGRIAVQLAAALLGVSVQGGSQVGFASLVDLQSGEVVWFNHMYSGTGDLRTQDSASQTVAYLLDGLPQ